MVTPVSIVTNLILTPLVAALLGLSLFSTAIAPISTSLSRRCNQWNACIARTCIQTTTLFARIPGGHALVSPHQPEHDAIHVYDLPRGGAAMVVQGHQADALFDCGSERAFRSAVLPSLRYFGSEPDMLLLSHPEAAHIGGAAIALQQLPIRQIIGPVTEARSTSFRALQRSASAHAIPFFCAQEGIRLPQSQGVEWEILQTPSLKDPHEIADNRVVIYRLHFHGFRLLLLNDASAVDVAALSHIHPDMRCDVIIVGRHSLHPAPIVDLLDRTGAAAVIATHADFPETERLPDLWRSEVALHGASLYHQGETGMVSLLLGNDKSLRIEGFLNGQSIVLPARP